MYTRWNGLVEIQGVLGIAVAGILNAAGLDLSVANFSNNTR